MSWRKGISWADPHIVLGNGNDGTPIHTILILAEIPGKFSQPVIRKVKSSIVKQAREGGRDPFLFKEIPT